MNEDLIAPCGMNCAVCGGYLRDRTPCHGCRQAQQNKPKTRVNCKIRKCRKRTGDFCFSCTDFPCERLLHLDKRYRTRYDMSEIENLNFIKERGIEAFLKNQEKKYISSKGILCVHDKKYYGVKNG